MTNKKNPNLGSPFESWFVEKGFREEATAAAIKSVLAEQIAAAMKEQGLTKSRMPSSCTRAAPSSTACLTLPTTALRSKPSCALLKSWGVSFVSSLSKIETCAR